MTMEWLTRSIDEHTVAWVLLSSLLGGIVGGALGFLFEFILPERFKERREVLAIKRQFATPIFRSVDELRRRLRNMIQRIDNIETEGWLASEHVSGYYFISTSYVVGCLLAWLQILRRRVVYLDFTTTRETKTYEYFLETIQQGFSNPNLLGESSTGDPAASEDSWIFTFSLQHIGTALLISNNGDAVMDFGTFRRGFSDAGCREMSEAFDPLVSFFADLRQAEMRFRRIVAIHIILNAFVEYVDPKHLRSRKQEFRWDLLSNLEAERLRARLRLISPKIEAAAMRGIMNAVVSRQRPQSSSGQQ